MATANFLTVKTHLTEFRSNSDKDSISEASESGTTNSVTSAEELQKFALILGLNSAEDVYQERFRIDRRRLEGMLADTLEETQTAQAFFHRVMTETNTLIKWPTRLKIGARSKKDPHVRVAGRPESVKMAREKIMQLLDTRSNRVTMKIDVSYTDHSHIIGKGGLTIKRVMEETGCHIHFPDSNRTSTVEKSNQVSIAGDMERVERARARVRALTPLVFSFELPVSSSSQPLPDLNSSYVQQIQEQYNVQVMLRNRPKLHANLLVVKGVQWEVQSTMEATSLLMSFMCGSLVSQTQVQMTLEISPMHHPVVAGRGAEQLKIIMQGTNTQIMFPDADDPNIPMIKKSSVTITGQIDNVYNARQQLVGSLPLVVIFDVSEEACRFDADAVTRLMHKHNVYVNIRRKPKQGIASVVIKGIERCAGDIYEARRELLGGTEPAIAAEIPESYTIPAITTNSIPNFSTFNPFSPTHATNMPNINSPNMASPYNVTLADLASYANMASPMFGQHPPTPGGYPSPHSPAGPLFPPTWIIRSPQPRAGQFAYPSSGQQANKFAKQASWNPMSNGGDAAVNKMQPPIMVQASYQPSETRPTPATLSQILNSSSQASSGYQSNFTGSSVSLDTNNISGGESSNMVSPSVSPISKTHSPAPSSENERSQHELANIIHELPLSERRAVGCEKKTLETLNKLSPLSDYRRLKAEANMAMQESVGNGYRVPNTRWSGHYFSHTSPNPLNAKHPNNEMVTPPKHWQRAELSRPQIQSPAPAPTPGPGPSHSLPGPSHSPPGAVRPPRSADKPCRYTQLHELLRQLGLNKYIDLFKEHELDMSTFASLCEADLAEIGVTAFGARRKMLLVIAELQKQGSGFKTSNSPRAERKLFNSPKYNTDAISEKDKW